MENGYIKLNKYLLTTKKAGLLMQKEGVDGIGVYIILLLHLSRCEDCVGSYTPENMAILAVMAKKRPKFIRNIINNYGLFVVRGEEFTCPDLQKSYGIENPDDCWSTPVESENHEVSEEENERVSAEEKLNTEEEKEGDILQDNENDNENELHEDIVNVCDTGKCDSRSFTNEQLTISKSIANEQLTISKSIANEQQIDSKSTENRSCLISTRVMRTRNKDKDRDKNKYNQNNTSSSTTIVVKKKWRKAPGKAVEGGGASFDFMNKNHSGNQYLHAPPLQRMMIPHARDGVAV